MNHVSMGVVNVDYRAGSYNADNRVYGIATENDIIMSFVLSDNKIKEKNS